MDTYGFPLTFTYAYSGILLLVGLFSWGRESYFYVGGEYILLLGSHGFTHHIDSMLSLYFKISLAFNAKTLSSYLKYWYYIPWHHPWFNFWLNNPAYLLPFKTHHYTYWISSSVLILPKFIFFFHRHLLLILLLFFLFLLVTPSPSLLFLLIGLTLSIMGGLVVRNEPESTRPI